MASLVLDYLKKKYGKHASSILKNSTLLRYIEKKIGSVGPSPKSRANLGNLFAIYVLVEDYIKNNYHLKGDYSKYGGAKFMEI